MAKLKSDFIVTVQFQVVIRAEDGGDARLIASNTVETPVNPKAKYVDGSFRTTEVKATR